ncbi:uncharacterized protein LOC125766505 isoform X1 [Anopheles funestus]|uniref:uncharacterized protein LOC125766505 isoform X1 n=1 Tax=Anopheles funestus TaxID=62324 RepID=UPI0020C6CD8F|nr:uncharacterized protein LOC125766505 isoform X1 [Anopheles funestus]
MQPKCIIVTCLTIVWSAEVLCGEVENRHKRTLVFTSDSATGILIALSVPLLIPDRNIFLAYNFEANYGMPGKASDFTQGVLKKVDNDQIHPAPEGETESERTVRGTGTRFTRKQMYRTIELNLNRYGYNGKKCILRMICEIATYPVRDANGMIGDLLQLLFTYVFFHFKINITTLLHFSIFNTLQTIGIELRGIAERVLHGGGKRTSGELCQI